jgi:hypothetical protein
MVDVDHLLTCRGEVVVLVVMMLSAVDLLLVAEW